MNWRIVNGAGLMLLGLNVFIVAMWCSEGPKGDNPLWYALLVANGFVLSFALWALGGWLLFEESDR